ncbi:MAG: hypothetical protein ACR2QV_01025 [Gammaproteobacteria bacterium]
MQQWIAATLLGGVLGLALFGCVRLRMHLGPRIKARYGNQARHAYWLLTIVVMVALANLALLGLRAYFAAVPPVGNQLVMEIWFAVLALAVAMSLIFRRLYK